MEESGAKAAAGGGRRNDLRERTKQLAPRIARLYVSQPKTAEAQVTGKQALRSGTSVGAQYREAKRARSTAEFTSKIESGMQELDETLYWLELLADSGIVPASRPADLHNEANELLAIFVTPVKTAKQHQR